MSSTLNQMKGHLKALDVHAANINKRVSDNKKKAKAGFQDALQTILNKIKSYGVDITNQNQVREYLSNLEKENPVKYDILNHSLTTVLDQLDSMSK